MLRRTGGTEHFCSFGARMNVSQTQLDLEQAMFREMSRLRSNTTVRAILAGIALACAAVSAAPAQRGLPSDVLDVDDEPGRVSGEEAVISEGLYARQPVFFRSSEPPGTLV